MFPQDRFHDPLSPIEADFIKEFLNSRGYTEAALKKLKKEEARKLYAEASRYASCKLAEFESRAKFVDKIHLDEK